VTGLSAPTGKSNFGVVTALEFALFPVTRLYAGSLFYPGKHALEVLHAYQRLAAQAPDDLTSSVALLRLPDLPFIPEFMRGTLTVNIRISYLGSASDGEQLVAPLRTVAPTLMDTVAEMPYTDYASIIPGSAEPGAAVEHFAFLSELTPAAIDAIIKAAGPEADSRINIVEMRHLGGALGRPPESDSAVRHSDAAFALFTLTFIPPSDVDASKSSGLELLDHLRPWLSDQKHPSFLSPADATAEQTRKAFDAPAYERLQVIKAEYDPHNLFRFNHNEGYSGGCSENEVVPLNCESFRDRTTGCVFLRGVTFLVVPVMR
jgi:hypothetical protein